MVYKSVNPAGGDNVTILLNQGNGILGERQNVTFGHGPGLTKKNKLIKKNKKIKKIV